MGNEQVLGVNLYTVLGMPVDVDSVRVRQVIDQHLQANLLPAHVLKKAEQYLLNDGIRQRYNRYLQHVKNFQTASVAQTNLYASLQLAVTATPQQIKTALQQQAHELPLQTWLLARKWLLHPRLRGRYDAHWQQHWAPAPITVLPPANTPATLPPTLPLPSPRWQHIAGVLVLGALPAWYAHHVHSTFPTAEQQTRVLPPIVLAVPAGLALSSIDITAVGDTTLGSHLGNTGAGTLPAVWRQQGDGYFMQEVADVLAHDDLTIANLEGPLTTATNGLNKPFVFKGNGELAGILKQGSVEAVNVANNHSHDYGAQGFADTLQTLQQQNIAAFGYQHYQVHTINGKRIGLAGAKAWTLAQGMQAVDEAVAHFKNENIDYLMVSFHWGQERQYQANATQRAIAHYAIDQGVNTVLGHHPHVVQGMERYKNGVIVYSLANFVFGGNGNPSDKDSVAVRLRVDFVGNKWVAHDVTAVPLLVSGRSQGNDYRPVWAADGAKQRVLRKMQTSSNVDVRLGWRGESQDGLAATVPSAASGSKWCDDSASVWMATGLLPPCNRDVITQHWG